MNIFASDILFYVFGALAVVLSLMVVFMRNPVSSAMMMALSFGATAAVMIGLGAHFLGILQILVYAGAIMVLFAFIIMLLNVKQETSPFSRPFLRRYRCHHRRPLPRPAYWHHLFFARRQRNAPLPDGQRGTGLERFENRAGGRSPLQNRNGNSRL